jgi:hypothetical protein
VPGEKRGSYQRRKTMDTNDLVTVTKLTDPYLAEIIRGALESEGIPCRLGGEGQAASLGTFAIDVLVRAIDADRAEKIIASHEKS